MIRLFACLFLTVNAAYATTGPVTGGYHIDNGQNATITAHSVTKKVTNNHGSGLTVYVPLNTSEEWATYIGNPPLGVAIENVSITCPVGYVLVPAMSPYTAQDFCVAKYEMKKNVDGVATSQAAGTPWGSIKRNSARTQCNNLGSGYQLISNAQWQTIARNIEQVGENWSSGTVGTGKLNRGHADGSPTSALAADASDANACSGTGQTCSDTVWNFERRTHILSNGGVIWDLGGNVWEWTSDDYDDLGVSPSMNGNWRDYNNVAVGATNRALFGPSNDTWTSASYGIGQIYGSAGGAVRRGGSSNDGSAIAGVFATNLNYGSSGTAALVGFRCVFVP